MLYHFYITVHRPEGRSNSIWRLRDYDSVELTETDMKNIKYVMEQAVATRGLADGVGKVGTHFSDSFPSWGTSVPLYSENAELKPQNAREIAQQVLNDLEEFESGKKLFADNGSSFANLDFNEFSYIDETTSNDDLKVVIGKKVYVREQRDRIYTYQGRPNNDQIRNKNTLIKVKTKIWATDSHVIAVDDFDANNYADRIESFPLPSIGSARKGLGNNEYFARTKDKYPIKGREPLEWRYEGLGKTEEQARTLLALELAFNGILEPGTWVGESNTMDLLSL